MADSEETFLTVAEIAGQLKMNQQTVRSWIDAGTLRLCQLDDGELLGPHAGRGLQPQEVEDADRARDRAPRLHRALAQHPSTALRARDAHPAGIEDRWLKSQEERLSPTTRPDQSADERLAAGLSDIRLRSATHIKIYF